jgi:predicted HicB family RNase H-like nuclease
LSGPDFHAAGVEGLKRKGEVSLRVDPDIHEAAVIAAAAHGQSLNQWAGEAIKQAALAS